MLNLYSNDNDKEGIKLTRAILTLIFLALLSSCAINSPAAPVNYVKLYQLQADFEEVRDELVSVIEERGMVISFISHTAKMLERTAATVTEPGNLYGDAEVLLFCKADLSHQLAVSDPHSVILCPQAIAVYTLKKDASIVYLSIEKPPENLEAYQGIFQLLDEMIQQVIDEIG